MRTRCTALREGLGLWRGRALADFADEPWAQSFATHLEELRAVATEDLAETLIQLGHNNAAGEVIEPQLATFPYRERPVALLMRAWAADGRVAEALRVFQRFRVQLRDETGLEPTSELRSIEANMLGGLDPDREDAAPTRSNLPSGTVTFMFTDIEGSTERWQRDEAAMSAALADHDRAVRAAVESNDGRVFKHTGDGICAVFTSARQAATAAVAARRDLRLPVRIGLHTGEAELRDGDYYGPTLNRTARVMDAGHGNQILLSTASAALVTGLELVDLGEHHLKGIAEPVRLLQLGRGAFPPPRARRRLLGNVPAELSVFVGRQEELGGLCAELLEHRLVTLVGVGGAGKTRLAVEAAAALTSSFPDGCWYVELATVVVSGAVEFAFVAGLGLTAPSEGDVISGIVEATKQKRLLIVVDNCEHVLTATAEAIEEIVSGCPAATVLATSREPLMISGERLRPLSSLRPEDADRLFVERAVAEAPDLVIDSVQASAITDLCTRLDRLPLAIELAASGVRAFSPVELAASLDERFRLLTGGRRARVDRHQTMRNTIDWSYELCTANEQLVFDRLSVFPAAFRLDDARAVAGGAPITDLEITAVLPRLVDRSMVQRATRPDGTSQYQLLESMRAYGREHLFADGIADLFRERHANHTMSMINALSLATIGPDEQAARQRITQLLPDCLTAFAWFVDRCEWEAARSVCTFGWAPCQREEITLHRSLLDTLTSAATAPDLVAELTIGLSNLGELAIDEGNRRAWRLIDSGWRPPLHRFSYPPQNSIDAADEETMRADALLDSLRTLRDAPAATRCCTEYVVMRMLATARPDLAASHLPAFEALLLSAESISARAVRAEIRGQVAWSMGDVEEAARWFEDALSISPEGWPVPWFHLNLSWWRLVARAMADLPIYGSDLADPWRFQREHRIGMLTPWGASATAVVLERLSNAVLARRFRQWCIQSDPGGMSRLMEMRLAPTGLRLNGPPSEPIDLDEIVDELFEYAIGLPQLLSASDTPS